MAERINIAGWSPYRMAGGVTGHLLAMSEMAALYYGLKVDVRADHFGARPIEGYIWDFRRVKPLSDSGDFYSGPDYPDYSRNVIQYECRYMKGLKGRTGSYALADNLNLLKPVDYRDESAFSGGSGDICFVDSSGNNSPYSFRVLNEADMIMVFLPCNPTEVRTFFRLYSYYISKSFFIFNFFSGQNEKLNMILDEYDIPRSRVATIPYSPELARACMQKTLDTLIASQLADRKHTEYFIRIKNITKRVLIEARRMQKA